MKLFLPSEPKNFLRSSARCDIVSSSVASIGMDALNCEASFRARKRPVRSSGTNALYLVEFSEHGLERNTFSAHESDKEKKCIEFCGRSSTHSIPEIIFSYSSHHGTFARFLARAIMVSFFSVAGSMLVMNLKCGLFEEDVGCSRQE